MDCSRTREKAGRSVSEEASKQSRDLGGNRSSEDGEEKQVQKTI